MPPAGLTAQEWRTLQFAPFWIMSTVVGTSRDFEEEDYDAFLWAIQLAVTGSTPGLTQELMRSVIAERRELLAAYAVDSRPIGSGLYQVGRILATLSLDEAIRFRQVLVIGIGAAVARARGRHGRVISDDDADALATAEQMLV